MQTVRDGSSVILRPKGKLNTTTAPEFNKLASESINGASEVTIDLDGLDFISSAGIRSLMTIRNAVGSDRLHIINAKGLVLEVFEISGITALLEG